MTLVNRLDDNFKRRVDSVFRFTSREIEIARKSFNDLVNLKPVQAVLGVTVETIDNVGDLVKDQAKITREWLS
ncbi:MAG: hypothetical protein QXI12_05230 [Candidatus Methanomethyliaceae archaeon]